MQLAIKRTMLILACLDVVMMLRAAHQGNVAMTIAYMFLTVVASAAYLLD